LAEGGSIFLDEIGELPAETQEDAQRVPEISVVLVVPEPRREGIVQYDAIC
jgi:transcriptional regulator of acetoin/glycerol metabolism